MSNFTIIIISIFVILYAYHRITSNKTALKNIQLGANFLAENGQKEAIITTSSGMQYEILNKGDGTVFPRETSKVKVHYHGTLINGAQFDSSVVRGKPISFSLNKVIKGWIEGVQLMNEGDMFRFYIPSDLAYGKRAVGKIPAGSLLIFDIELLEIN